MSHVEPQAGAVEPAAKKPRPQATLSVLRREQLAPHMVRIVAGGPGLAAFVPKDVTDMYVKIHFPLPGVDYPEPLDVNTVRAGLPRELWPVTRTYTVRRVDLAAGELTLDFVIHGDDGLAGPWAASAEPGDRLIVTGPGGAYRPDPDAGWHLFAADDSALPAVAAALEALPADAVGQAFLEVDTPADVLTLDAPDGVALTWLFRDGRTPAECDVLVDAVAGAVWPEGRVHAFIHGERESVKKLRDVLFKQRGLDRSQVSISGYWAFGRSEDRFQAEKREPIGKIL